MAGGNIGDSLGMDREQMLQRISMALGGRIADFWCRKRTYLVGAGGFGQPILTGIRLADTSLILEGAIPAALLALAAQGALDLAERVIVPKGLRLTRGR